MTLNATTFLVFGDLHGRILPAFRLASAWARDTGTPVAGLLQVGDLGYFPDTSRLDRATLRHALDDPLELGAGLIAEPSKEADAVFREDTVAEALWFTAGNHEDFEALAACERHARGKNDFPVDAYLKVRCIRDGQVAVLPGSLRVGALWGIDDLAPRARRHTPAPACIQLRSANALAHSSFDVLLTHDSPLGAVKPGSGSELIDEVIRRAKPRFAFFGHYRGKGGPAAVDLGETQVFHMRGFELRREGSCAEEGSVGVLRWHDDDGDFEYLDKGWLRTFTRHNWTCR